MNVNVRIVIVLSAIVAVEAKNHARVKRVRADPQKVARLKLAAILAIANEAVATAPVLIVQGPNVPALTAPVQIGEVAVIERGRSAVRVCAI